MSVRRAARALAGVALVPVLLAGCGGDGESPETAATSASASPSETGGEDSTGSGTTSGAGSASEEPESTSVFELSAGDCFQDPSDASIEDGIRELPVVPCDTPHDNEVFAVVTLPDGDFPGQEGLQSVAEEECVAAFEEYVGVPYDESDFVVFPIPPSSDSWEQGDRELLCTLFLEGEQTTGSAEGSER